MSSERFANKYICKLLFSATHSVSPSISHISKTVVELAEQCHMSCGGENNCAVLFNETMRWLKSDRIQVRRNAFLIIDELFPLVQLFRNQCIFYLQDIFRYTIGTDLLHCPPPKPKALAAELKSFALKQITVWINRYESSCPKLAVARVFLKEAKRIDIDNLQSSTSAYFHVTSNTIKRKDRVASKITDNVRVAFEESQPEMEQCFTEMESCFRLLLSYDGDDFSKNSKATEVSCEAEVPDDDDVDFRLHGVRNVQMMNDIQVSVNLHGGLDVDHTIDTEALIATLCDHFKLIMQRFLPNVHKWLKSVSRLDADHALMKLLIDYKNRLQQQKGKFEELNVKKPEHNLALRGGGNESDSDDSDFEEVPNKEGFDPDFRSDIPINDVPTYILDASRKDYENAARKHVKKSSSKLMAIEPVDDIPSCSNFIRADSVVKKKVHDTAPVLDYGLDLKYWECDKIEPASMVSNNADSHRFWRPTDDSVESVAANAVELYRSRVITFAGNSDVRVERSCGAPLAQGGLCQRHDKVTCPFHGKIIDRDVGGVPLADQPDPPASTSVISRADTAPPWQDPDLLADVSAATGVNLLPKNTGSSKRSRGSKEKLLDPDAADTSLKRLKRKVFSSSSVKRVAKHLDEVDCQKSQKKFAHSWQYSMQS